jgi:hypothetical protein
MISQMKKVVPFIIVLILIIPAFYISYKKKIDPNPYVNYSDKLILPFDTAKVLAMMNIVDSVNFAWQFIDEAPFALFTDSASTVFPLDTLTLLDLRWACDCPNWRYADSIRQDYPQNKDFYIEPAADKLKLPEHLLPGQRIQFIGREIPGMGYPKNPGFMDPNPPKGRVFRYYAYKIYKPFKVYGPDLNLQIDDGVYDMCELTVK